MLYLISAPPRTGKSLKAIEIIFKYLNMGRIVYTNIVGIKIPGVITFSGSIDDPHDWRDLPNDSVVIYDEAHEHPAFADRNLIQDKAKMAKVRDIGISLTLHGHFGFDIYMITQNPRLLAPEVLASVGTHYIMRRKFGVDMATIFEYAEAKTTFSKSAAKDALNTTFWRFPKHLYKFYVSSEVHNIKKTFPKKYYLFALIPIFLFGYAFMNGQKTGFFGLLSKDKKDQVKVKPQNNIESSSKSPLNNPFNKSPDSLSNNNQPSFHDESNRVASVFLNGNKCRAYNGNSELMPIPTKLCIEFANNPSRLSSAAPEIVEQRLKAINYTQYNNSFNTVTDDPSS